MLVKGKGGFAVPNIALSQIGLEICKGPSKANNYFYLVHANCLLSDNLLHGVLGKKGAKVNTVFFSQASPIVLWNIKTRDFHLHPLSTPFCLGCGNQVGKNFLRQMRLEPPSLKKKVSYPQSRYGADLVFNRFVSKNDYLDIRKLDWQGELPIRPEIFRRQKKVIELYKANGGEEIIDTSPSLSFFRITSKAFQKDIITKASLPNLTSSGVSIPTNVGAVFMQGGKQKKKHFHL